MQILSETELPLGRKEEDKDLSFCLHFLIFKSMNVFTNFSCTFFNEKHVQVTCLQKYGDILTEGSANRHGRNKEHTGFWSGMKEKGMPQS